MNLFEVPFDSHFLLTGAGQNKTPRAAHETPSQKSESDPPFVTLNHGARDAYTLLDAEI